MANSWRTRRRWRRTIADRDLRHATVEIQTKVRDRARRYKGTPSGSRRMCTSANRNRRRSNVASRTSTGHAEPAVDEDSGRHSRSEEPRRPASCPASGGKKWHLRVPHRREAKANWPPGVARGWTAGPPRAEPARPCGRLPGAMALGAAVAVQPDAARRLRRRRCTQHVTPPSTIPAAADSSTAVRDSLLLASCLRDGRWDAPPAASTRPRSSPLHPRRHRRAPLADEDPQGPRDTPKHHPGQLPFLSELKPRHRPCTPWTTNSSQPYLSTSAMTRLFAASRLLRHGRPAAASGALATRSRDLDLEQEG